MKKNFLITTALPDTWEINENNFLLGTWCEFHESNFLDEKASKNIAIIKNIHHWDNLEKKFKDYKYIEEKLEHLLEVISDKLSLTHNVRESKEYWKI